MYLCSNVDEKLFTNLLKCDIFNSIKIKFIVLQRWILASHFKSKASNNVNVSLLLTILL